MTSSTTAREPLQRVIFPQVHDPDLVPLYVDADHWGSFSVYEDQGAKDSQRGFIADQSDRAVVRLSDFGIASAMQGERGFRVPHRRRASFGTYFNAFPASYWQKWSTLTAVDLQVATRGAGRVIVYRSNARGVIQRVEAHAVTGESTLEIALALTHFVDGGWYWFDLVAEEADFELVQAGWYPTVDAESARSQTASVAITTFNRGAYCLQLLRDIASNPTVLQSLDNVYVIDQGTEKLAELPDFRAVEASFGGKLRVIEQSNLGGSGGFSRGMHETIAEGASDYVLLLDDDIEVEPESILRALRFGQYQIEPTIIGGHMFDMYDRSKLHAFSEGFDGWNFMWGSLTPQRHDFAEANLRQTKWLHRRIDSEYNGWWMSLIPVSVIKEIGYSMPMFIKWDDAEFSLRARDHGTKTVSLPGAAVWHVSWVDKDDTQDWQAFFHARNRLVAALLHSRHKKGGGLARDNLAIDLKHLLSMQYFAVSARHEAYASVLEGPTGLHDDIQNRLPKVRALAAGFTETSGIRSRGDVPRVVTESAITENTRFSRNPPRGTTLRKWLLSTVLLHAVGGSHVGSPPAAHLSFEDAKWWILPKFPSVLVSSADGSAVHLHQRDSRQFRRLLLQSLKNYLRVRRGWAGLSAEYRDESKALASAAAWERTFAGESSSPRLP